MREVIVLGEEGEGLMPDILIAFFILFEKWRLEYWVPFVSLLTIIADFILREY